MSIMKAFLTRALVAVALVAALAAVPVAFSNPKEGEQGGVSRAPARGHVEFKIVYNAGEQADFSIEGDGDTTLQIGVWDGQGGLVVQTTGPGDRRHVSWTPRDTRRFTIWVINEGNVYNQFTWRAY